MRVLIVLKFFILLCNYKAHLTPNILNLSMYIYLRLDLVCSPKLYQLFEIFSLDRDDQTYKLLRRSGTTPKSWND